MVSVSRFAAAVGLMGLIAARLRSICTAVEAVAIGLSGSVPLLFPETLKTDPLKP